MNISKIEAVVFDCDGVLFDTALANRKFYDQVLESFKKPCLTEQQFINVHMMTVGAAVRYLFPEFDNHDLVFECLQQIGYEKFIKYMKMEDGLVPLLKALKDNGLTRGIATNRTNTMEKVLKDNGLNNYFEMVVTAADVVKPKPDPEQLIKIMDRFALSPDQIVFIGDSEYDQKAASQAGTWFIAFKQPGLKADANVDSMEEIGMVLQIDK